MAGDNAPDFATLLRRYRRERRLTQEELAERAGVSPEAISMLERGLTQAPQRGTVRRARTSRPLQLTRRPPEAPRGLRGPGEISLFH